MPIVYITQLLGLALGIGSGKLGFSKLMVPATTVLGKIEVTSNG
jgi:heterodisulfide reductase subunit B